MKNKKVIIIISSIVVLVALIGIYFYWNKQKAAKEAENKIQTVAVKKDSITSSIFTSGKVAANLDIEIKCKASGEIVSLPFDVSNNVKKGALLLKLNPIDEQRNVRQAEISLLQSKNALEKARKDLMLSQANLITGKNQASISVESARVKARDLRTKAENERKLYTMSTQRKLAVAALESAKIKAKDLRTKAENTRKLYMERAILSKNDYDTALTAAQQADVEVRNAQIRLNEQDTNNKNDYQTALTAASQAESDVRNAESRLKEQSNSSINLDIKNQDILSAESKVESDKLQLLDAQQRLKETSVFAPISGVITNRPVQVGQIITSGTSSVSGGTTVLTLSDLSRMFVMASVDESDIGKVKVGQSANITADAYPDKKFRGKVMQIYTKGNNVSNVVTFPVKIEIVSKNKSLLKPEMTSNIEIVENSKQNILVVDSGALSRKKGKFYVKVLKSDNTQQDVPVKVGINNDTTYEITEGLKEGDKVVVSSADEGKWKNTPGAGGANVRNGAGGGNRNSTGSMMRQTRRVTGGGGGGSR